MRTAGCKSVAGTCAGFFSAHNASAHSPAMAATPTSLSIDARAMKSCSPFFAPSTLQSKSHDSHLEGQIALNWHACPPAFDGAPHCAYKTLSVECREDAACPGCVSEADRLWPECRKHAKHPRLAARPAPPRQNPVPLPAKTPGSFRSIKTPFSSCSRASSRRPG